MRIALINASTTHWLAGDPAASQRVHSWAGDFGLTPTAEVQVGRYIDADYAKTFDRGNLSNVVSFTTARTFTTAAEAEIFALELDSAPRTGTLVFECVGVSSSTYKQMADAVLSPPSRKLTGATLYLTYRATGGAITTLGTGPRTATLDPAGTENAILLSSTNLTHTTAALVIDTDSPYALTAALAGGAVTIRAGATRIMQIDADFGAGSTIIDLLYRAILSGKPRFATSAFLSPSHQVQWSGTEWQIFTLADGLVFTSAEDVATPDLVTSWTPVGAGVSVASITAVSAYASECIAAVTAAGIIGLTAANAPGNDGSGEVAAVTAVNFAF